MIDGDAIVVVAAVIEQDDAFLLTRRQPGTHLAGYWEFPGGKCHAGEGREEALCREILEELDAHIGGLREIFVTAHRYPDRAVELHFYRCSLTAPPRPRLGQELRWVPRADLQTLEFPAADAELIATLVNGGV